MLPATFRKSSVEASQFGAPQAQNNIHHVAYGCPGSLLQSSLVFVWGPGCSRRYTVPASSLRTVGVLQDPEGTSPATGGFMSGDANLHQAHESLCQTLGSSGGWDGWWRCRGGGEAGVRCSRPTRGGDPTSPGGGGQLIRSQVPEGGLPGLLCPQGRQVDIPRGSSGPLLLSS